jgi:hypothetical protein
MTAYDTDPWSDLLLRIAELWRWASHGALDFVVVLVVLLAGWALATMISRLVGAMVRLLRIDQGMRGVFGERATARHEPARVASWGAYWILMAAAILLAFEIFGFHLASSVAERLGEVVPRIVASAVLFAVGSIVALMVGGVVRRFLESAEVRVARLQGQVVTAVLTGFAALVALEQLGFAAQFVMAIGVVVIAATGLGAALAFGLGCRDLARDFVVEYLRSLENDAPKRPE